MNIYNSECYNFFMKLAVISDIHGNMAYLEKAKEIIDKRAIKIVICCGDIQTEESFFELDSWNQKVLLALGNSDYSLRQQLDLGIIWPEKLKYYLDYGVLNLVGKKIAFCHNDHLARKLAKDNKFDVVFYGHTHTPWEESINRTFLLNPGEIASQFGKSTFAIYDLKNMKAELILLN